MRFRLFAILCVSLLPGYLSGQNIYRISNREGLSNSSILSLCQDASGYIWAGSCEGLNLWDGTYARTYNLTGNLIQELAATDDGFVWVRTNYGLDRLDTRDRRIVSFPDYPRVYLFTARSRDKAFFIRGGKLYGFSAAEGDFVELPFAGDLSGVVKIWIAPDDNLWIVRRDGIGCAKVTVQPGGRSGLEPEEQIVHAEGVDFSCADGAGCLYFTDSEGVLYGFDTRLGRAFVIYDLKDEIRRRGDLSAVIRDKNDYVVAFEMNGALRLHAADSPEGAYVLREIEVDCGVFALLKDRNQDIVWIGTDGSGLLRQSDGDISVRSVTYDDLPFPLSKPVKSLFVDGAGSLWIGTKNDGILRIDDFYRATEFTRSNTRCFDMGNSALPRNSVYTFAPGRGEVLWIGGDGGVSYYSYRDGRIHSLPGGESLRNVHGLLEGDDSTLWAATVGNGVFRISLDGTEARPVARRIEALDLGAEVRKVNFFFSICRESDSVLWFSNHGVGAVRYHTRTGRSEVVGFGPGRGLAGNDVTVGVRCSDGTLWFGSGCGMNRYRASDTLRAPEYNHDLLSHGVIHGLLCDSLDNIWASTNAGIIRYDPQTNRSVAYGNSYGLDVVEFSDGAYFYDRRAGKLFFGGINGFVVVSDTEAPAVGSYMPPIEFREVTTNGQTYAIAGLMRDNTLVLNHRQSAFGLSLIALDYIDGGNYSYLYKIDNFHGEWNDNRYNNQLLFANLPPGRYTLLVRYRNDMTGELSPVYRLAIRLRPPAYASAWAWVLYLVAGAGLLTVAGVYYVRRRRRERERRRALYEQRQKELLYQSRIWSFAHFTNELSIPLTLINGPCRQILDSKSADGYVRRQAEFIRRNAEKLNDLIYVLNEFKSADPADGAEEIELLDLSKLAGGIAHTYVEYAETNGVAYRTQIASELFFPAARSALAAIFNILLSNAFRRTSAEGEVTLSVEADGAQSRVTIANRGRGFDPGRIALIFDRYKLFDNLEEVNRKGGSLMEEMELAICCNFIQRLKGSLHVQSEGDRTVFRVELPRLPVTRATQEGYGPEMLPVRNLNLAAPALRPAPVFSASLPTMLVVNEDADMNAFVADLFAGEYNVLVIDRFEQVAAKLQESLPRIIICGAVSLDRRMIETIRTIRCHKRLTNVPLILLSATPRPDTKIEGLELGVDICLTLPFNITHLRNVAGELVRKYESLKDYGRSASSSFDLTGGRMLHKEDKAFLDRMLEVIRTGILDPGMSTQFIADRMGMSLCNLYRRLGTVTDQTPASIVKEYRLCMAERLLLTTKLSIDEIIYKSGFANRSTFFRGFTARFGSTPKAYREQKIREAIDPEAL